MESDAKALMRTIKSQLLAPWVAYSYGPDKGVPVFMIRAEEAEDMERIARVYGILVKDVNFQGIPEDHIYERFGIPRPKAGEAAGMGN